MTCRFESSLKQKGGDEMQPSTSADPMLSQPCPEQPSGQVGAKTCEEWIKDFLDTPARKASNGID
jgi:hypothetical protein